MDVIWTPQKVSKMGTQIIDFRGVLWEYSNNTYEPVRTPLLDPNQKIINDRALTQDGKIYDLEKQRVIEIDYVLKQFDKSYQLENVLFAVTDDNQLLRIRLKKSGPTVRVITKGVLLITGAYVATNRGRVEDATITVINMDGRLMTLTLNNSLTRVIHVKKMRKVGTDIKLLKNDILITSEGCFMNPLVWDDSPVWISVPAPPGTIDLMTLPMNRGDEDRRSIIALDEDGNLFSSYYNIGAPHESLDDFEPCYNGIVNNMGKEDMWAKLIYIDGSMGYIGLIAMSGKPYEINSDFAIVTLNDIPQEIYNTLASNTKSAANKMK